MRQSVFAMSTAFMVFPVATAFAQPLPTFDIQQLCRSYEASCMTGETQSRTELAQNWPAADSGLRQRCVAWENRFSVKYAPERIAVLRYTNLKRCIESQGRFAPE